MHVGLDLEAEAGGHLDQFHATVGTGLAQQFQCALHAAGRRRLVFRKQPQQLRQRQRLAAGQQGGFDNAGDQRLIHSMIGFR